MTCLLPLLLALLPAPQAQAYADDGAWCWFADPRAVVVDEALVVGSVQSDGDLVVTRFPEGRPAGSEAAILHAGFERDDHANPALLPLPDGRLLVFYAKHNGADMFVREHQGGNDWDAWSPERRLDLVTAATTSGRAPTFTYPNPVYLAREGLIAMTWRGLNWKPTISFSRDLGETWSEAQVLLSEEAERPGNRPYVKVVGDGLGRMHVIATDGHPRNEATNSIYHFYYEAGAFYRMDGTRIATIDSLPIRPADCDVIYDGKAEGVRAWVWDVALDDAGRPVVSYTRLPREDAHVYRYARWNGQRWVDRRICEGGGWFPQTPEGQREPEPHYSGGVVLDHQDPRFVLLSRPVDGRFQVEQWFTADGGEHWSHRPLDGDALDAVRPVVARGTLAGGTPALWMSNRRYRHYTDFDSALRGTLLDRRPYDTALQAEAIRRVAGEVAAWQLAHGPGFGIREWQTAPYLAGLLAASRAGVAEHRAEVRAMAEEAQWQLGPRPWMADDHAVGQAYLELYLEEPAPERLAACRARADAMLERPFDESLQWQGGIWDREWAWCDALFMAPPMLALLSEATGDPRYLDLMDRLWWKTTDYLYSQEHHLYWRDSRFFERQEPNGMPMFWSRGNGWVMAGLARVLQHMPADYPTRPRYEALFKDMAQALRDCQRADGTWSPGLLDAEAYPLPETSGTGFFCFALAYGLRSGLLDETTYRPTVERAWAALVAAVDPNGRLGWVQPVSDRPQSVRADASSCYAVGGFLLAASELMSLIHG